MRLRWTMLRDLGSSRVLRTSYFWLFFVPVAAKALEKVEETLSLSLFGDVWNISLSLPFSWKVFYFSAVSFAIASFLYSWLCPPLVKRHKSFPEFLDEGRGATYLRNHATSFDDAIQNQVKGSLSIWGTNQPLEVRQPYLADAFWTLRQTENFSNPIGLIVCSVFYAVGFALVVYLLAENTMYVASLTWSGG